MKKFNHILLLALGLLLISCGSSTENREQKDTTTTIEPKVYAEIIKAEWFLGKWENLSDEGNLFESWEKKNDSVYSGTSCFMMGKDTFPCDILSLEQLGNDLFYIPTIPGQNEGQPVKFKLNDSSTPDLLIFENPEHDFPQEISYTRINPDSMVAQISGMNEGVADTMIYPMRRAK